MADDRNEPSVQVIYDPEDIMELIRADMKKRFNIEPTDAAMDFREGTNRWTIEVSPWYLRRIAEEGEKR